MVSWARAEAGEGREEQWDSGYGFGDETQDVLIGRGL